MKLLAAIAFFAAAHSAAASDSFSSALSAAAPPHPALYSFADVYRLTVSGAGLDGFTAIAGTDASIRVVAQSAATPETQFSVVSMAQPQRWLLLLAGLAAALWVARRRLGYFF